MKVNFLTSPACSGLGLFELALRRSGASLIDLPKNPFRNGREDVDFNFDVNTVYTTCNQISIGWLRNIAEETLIVLRCPVTSLLCLFEKHCNRLGRELVDEEVYFYTDHFVRQFVSINGLVDHGIKYFVLKDDDRLMGRINGLFKDVFAHIKCDSMPYVNEEDLETFYAMSQRDTYTDLSMVSRENMEHVKRIGTMYGKLGIDIEV